MEFEIARLGVCSTCDVRVVLQLSTDHAPALSQLTGGEGERIVRAVKTLSTKFTVDRGGHLIEYGMAPQVYNRMVQQLGGRKTRDGRICFTGCPAAKEVY